MVHREVNPEEDCFTTEDLVAIEDMSDTLRAMWNVVGRLLTAKVWAIGTPLLLVFGGAPGSNESEAFSHFLMNSIHSSGMPKKPRTVKIESWGSDGPNLRGGQHRVPGPDRIHIPFEVSPNDGTLTMQSTLEVDFRVHNL